LVLFRPGRVWDEVEGRTHGFCHLAETRLEAEGRGEGRHTVAFDSVPVPVGLLEGHDFVRGHELPADDGAVHTSAVAALAPALTPCRVDDFVAADAFARNACGLNGAAAEKHLGEEVREKLSCLFAPVDEVDAVYVLSANNKTCAGSTPAEGGGDERFARGF